MRQLLAYTLTALLFVSTTGVPVHKMICLCKGEQVISWFSEAEMSCCLHAETPSKQLCCSSQQGNPDSDKDNCQDRETTLARIDVQFLADKSLQSSEEAQALHLGIWTAGFIHDFQVQISKGFVPSFHAIQISGPPIYRSGCQIRC